MIDPCLSSAASDTVSGEVLDLAALRDRCLGNLEFMERILGRFDQRLDSELAEIEAALGGSDLEKVTYLAHRLKGNSANVSALRLHGLATTIEELGRAGAAAEIPAHVAALRTEQRRYRERISALGGGPRDEPSPSAPPPSIPRQP